MELEKTLHKMLSLFMLNPLNKLGIEGNFFRGPWLARLGEHATLDLGGHEFKLTKKEK